MKRIYMDHAATTPLRPEVREAMMPYLTDAYGNPSSLHAFGRESRIALDTARHHIACVTSIAIRANSYSPAAGRKAITPRCSEQLGSV